MQPLEACPLPQVPVSLAPDRQPLAGGLELLARGAPHDAWHAIPLWPPGKRASQQGDALLHAGVQTTAPPPGGFLCGTLEGALLQPLGEHPGEPLCVLPRAEGADPGVGRAAPPCLTPTMGRDDLVTPAVQGLGQRPIGQDG